MKKMQRSISQANTFTHEAILSRRGIIDDASALLISVAFKFTPPTAVRESGENTF